MWMRMDKMDIGSRGLGVSVSRVASLKQFVGTIEEDILHDRI